LLGQVQVSGVATRHTIRPYWVFLGQLIIKVIFAKQVVPLCTELLSLFTESPRRVLLGNSA
jgi:hypothetical protein